MPALHRQIQTQTIAIANGAQTSTNAVDGRGFAAFGLELPAAFTGTSLTFKTCSTAGGTFQDLYNSAGVLVSIPIVANSRNFYAPDELSPWPYWKIVSGSAEGGARSITVTGKG